MDTNTTNTQRSTTLGVSSKLTAEQRRAVLLAAARSTSLPSYASARWARMEAANDNGNSAVAEAKLKEYVK